MFSPHRHQESIDKIHKFLEVEQIKGENAYYDDIINASKQIEFPNTTRLDCIRFFESTYREVINKFESATPQNWIDDLEKLSK